MTQIQYPYKSLFEKHVSDLGEPDKDGWTTGTCLCCGNPDTFRANLKSGRWACLPTPRPTPSNDSDDTGIEQVTPTVRNVPCNLSQGRKDKDALEPSGSSESIDLGDQPISSNREGSSVIRVRLSGIASLQITIDDSATEERLRDVLKAVRPQLESLRETVTSLECEPVGGRS